MPLALGDTTGASRSIQVLGLAEREALFFSADDFRVGTPSLGRVSIVSSGGALRFIAGAFF